MPHKAETDTCLAELRAALTGKDVRSIRAALLALDEHWVDLFDQREALTRDVLTALWHGAPFDTFQDLLALHLIDRPSAFAFFAGLTPPPDTSLLLKVVDVLGVPDVAADGSGFGAALVKRPDPEITDYLVGLIRRRAECQAQEGASFSNHVKQWSTFRYVRLAPKDADLAAALRALAGREDDRVPAILTALLKQLPWGEDRLSTATLIQCLAERPRAEYHAAIEQALDRHHELAPLRRYLLQGLFVYSREDALRLALADLNRSRTLDEQFDWIMLIDSWLERTDRPSLAPPAVGQAVAELDTAAWPRIARGTLALVLREGLPQIKAGRLSDPLDRFLARLIVGFLKCRIDHMGCGCILPLLFGLAWAFGFALSWVFGRPDPALVLLEYVAILAWVVTVGATSTTHFSGFETPSQWFVMALLFWATTLLCPVTIVAVHLASYLAR